MAGDNFNVDALKDEGQGTPPNSGTPPEGGNPPAGGDSNPPANPPVPPAGTEPTPAAGTPAANNGTPPAGDGTGTPPTPPVGGDGTPPTDPPPAGGDAPPTPPVDEAALRKQIEAEYLQSLGVTSREELEAKLKTPETPDEIRQREQKYKSDIDAYAVTKGVMSRDDIIALETMKNTEPETLVFNNFATEYRKTNPDATPETIQQEFRLFYHLDSEQAALKALGQERIKDAATGIINTLESKYNNAKESFDFESQRRAKVPEFQKLIQSSLDTHIPKQLPVYGDDDNKVLFDLSDADRKEAEKFLASADIFDEFFKEGSSQRVKDIVKDKIEGFLWLKNRNAILKTVYDAAESAGVKKGSTTGATQPFTLNNNGEKVPVTETDLTDADKQKLKGVLG